SVSISTDGDYILAGAPNANGRGRAYLFSNAGFFWNEVNMNFAASDAAFTDSFGESVQISPDATYAIIGASGNDDAGASSGSAYVFTGSGRTWPEQAKLVASDAAGSDYFGFSVALSPDKTVAAIGAYGDDDNGGESGSAYV